MKQIKKVRKKSIERLVGTSEYEERRGKRKKLSIQHQRNNVSIDHRKSD